MARAKLRLIIPSVLRPSQFVSSMALLVLFSACTTSNPAATQPGAQIPAPAPTTAGITPAKPGTVYEWRLNVIWSAADQKTGFIKQFVDLVAERSKGAIRITSFPGATLLDPNDAAKETSRGILKIDSGSFLDYEPFIPFLRVWFLPAYGLDMTDMRQVILPGTKGRGIMDEVLAQYDLKLLAGFEGGSNGLVAFDPLNTMDSLKGTKLRIVGTIASDTFRAAGAQVVVLSGSEAVDAMRKRLVVASNIDPAGVRSRGYHEFAKYWIDWRTVPNSAIIMINLSEWNRLPKELQDVLWTTAQEIEEKADKAVVGTQSTALSELTGRYGMSALAVDPREWAQLRAVGKDVIDRAVGELTPQASVREFLTLLEGAAAKKK